MKFSLVCILIILFFSSLGETWANPFRNRYVCVPKIVATTTDLEFRIRDGGPCAEGEQWMQVYRGKEGAILLYPSEGPLTKDVEQDLEEFKKFHGITR